MKTLSGLLLIMDDAKEQGDLRFSKDCVSDCGPVSYDIPIILDAPGGKLHNIFGRCNVSRYGNVLVYEGTLYDHKDDQLKKEICHIFYPCVVGKIIERDANGFITKFRVTDVMISTKNSDSRIPHLQMVES